MRDKADSIDLKYYTSVPLLIYNELEALTRASLGICCEIFHARPILAAQVANQNMDSFYIVHCRCQRYNTHKYYLFLEGFKR